MSNACAYCGRPSYGLDLSETDGGIYVEWMPCCLPAQEAVQKVGWQEFWGMPLEDVLEMEFGLNIRQVYLSDSLCRFSLYIKNPGGGVRGWQTEVFDDVDEHHSHHNAPVGWKFGIACYNGPTKVGVAVVGRPISRMMQSKHPDTLEVTRVCCFGDGRLRWNAASKMYGACAREAARRGYKRLVTYTLDSEEASSVKAANFMPTHKSEGGSWSRPSRDRQDDAPTCPKVRWELGLNKPWRKDIANRRIQLESDDIFTPDITEQLGTMI